jgi:hypothetical protein
VTDFELSDDLLSEQREYTQNKGKKMGNEIGKEGCMKEGVSHTIFF